ncbi:DUF5701 family protein [Actinoplanes sp. NPDC048988]|uniref:DUF5701 family protein n=1 Tax=Actinoplanes sp. NPDC048988 TaxID=3363901 RepID=UPI0037187ECA
MSLSHQLNRLIEAGLTDVTGVSPAELAAHVAELPDEPHGVLAVHATLATARQLAPLLRHRDKPGFVVEDLTDLEDFVPLDGLDVPAGPLYVIHDPDRGDDMRNWSPNEALPAILQRGRTPLTVNEGISWLLQEPKVLEPNHCFMTIGSRKPKGGALDARTPAIWISNGTGRDGATHRRAPKVGWCWAGNRHTWLGFASAGQRKPNTGGRISTTVQNHTAYTGK